MLHVEWLILLCFLHQNDRVAFHFSGKNGFYTLANAVLSNFPVLSAVAKNSVVGGEFIDIILIFF